MSLSGKITKWNDEKGYGFIKPFYREKEVFFHITAFKQINARPTIGDEITFDFIHDDQNREKAINVKGINNNDSISIPLFQYSISILLFILSIFILSVLKFLPFIIFWMYIIVSFITFYVYALDKQAAQNNKWRVSENKLHLLALFCGWPGALLAQQLLRHKSKKISFRQAFWVTFLANITFLIYLLTYGSLLSNILNKITLESIIFNLSQSK